MKQYNTTDLDPEAAFERHVFHRDQFAHYLRWSHVLRESKIGESFVDFGAGKGNLLEVLYRNRYKPSKYVGLEYRESQVKKAREKFKNLPFPVEFYQQDIIHPTMDYSEFQADKVVSFEVIEHVGKNNVDAFLKNFRACGHRKAMYYLSTPNYDKRVGAAGNHTYDSGDGRGKAVQEFDYFELEDAIEKNNFRVETTFGTFASQRDYKEYMNAWQQKAFHALERYYDSNLVSNIMAPIVDSANARNILWVLRQK